MSNMRFTRGDEDDVAVVERNSRARSSQFGLRAPAAS
jgi:hypothetical protein